MTIVESVETNNYSPLVELRERNLLFQGGIEEVAVIDLPSREVIGRIFFKGIVKALEIAPDASALHIMSKDYDNQAKKFNNFYYQLSFDRNDYSVLNEEIASLDQVTAIC